MRRDRQPDRPDPGDGRRRELRAQPVQPRRRRRMRQVGSLFKPFVYTAAIDRGYTARTRAPRRSPAIFDAGPGQPPYEPKNYDREYHGPITLRQALEESRNVPTVRLMAALGPRERRCTTRSSWASRRRCREYLSVAIGAAEGTLLEMTSAYSAFPNQGVRMTPLLILDVTDRDGNILEQHRAEPHEAIRADTAYIMTNLLEGVVQHGTGRRPPKAQLAARRQDRHDRRLHGRVVHRLRSGHHDRRLGRLRSEKADRHERRRARRRGAADLEGHHEDLDRPPPPRTRRPARLRAPRQHRHRRQRRPADRKSSSPGQNRSR